MYINILHRFFAGAPHMEEISNEIVNAIIAGDAAEVLGLIPSCCVDMVITSPPYNFGRPYNGEGNKDRKDWDSYFNELGRVWEECYRILKPGGRIAVNIQPCFSDNVPTHHILSEHLRRIGFLWRCEIIWNKKNYNMKNSTWGSWQSPSNPYIRYTWEYIEVFDKETHRKPGNRADIDISADEFKRYVNALWEIPAESRGKKFGHPAMFPEEIPKRLMLLFTYRGDLVVDPFNGAGTTTYVAHRLWRRFVGIDVSRKYCEIAYRRVVRQRILSPYPEPKLAVLEYSGQKRLGWLRAPGETCYQ